MRKNLIFFLAKTIKSSPNNKGDDIKSNIGKIAFPNKVKNFSSLFLLFLEIYVIFSRFFVCLPSNLLILVWLPKMLARIPENIFDVTTGVSRRNS